jgi:hypothetical protein
MRTAPYISDPVHFVTDPSVLFRHGPHIIEQPQPAPTGPVAGLPVIPNASAPKAFSTNTDLTTRQFTDVGAPASPAANTPSIPQQLELPFPKPAQPADPAAPAAAPATAAGSGSGGTKVPRQLAFDFPEPDPRGARFIADQAGNITDAAPSPPTQNLGPSDVASALQQRAAELNAARDPWMSRNGVTAIVRAVNVSTGQVGNFVATESFEMPAEFGRLLQPGETFIQAGGHAEQTLVNALGDEWQILEGGTSSNICTNICARLLKGANMRLGGDTFPGGPDRTPFRMFWWEP